MIMIILLKLSKIFDVYFKQLSHVKNNLRISQSYIK